jgi:hypothetical protein
MHGKKRSNGSGFDISIGECQSEWLKVRVDRTGVALHMYKDSTHENELRFRGAVERLLETVGLKRDRKEHRIRWFSHRRA